MFHKLNKKINWSIILLLIFFLLFFIKGLVMLDPDMGWSLAIGDIIVHKGIPTQDPFSYTLPHYHLIDHEWLSHVLMFLTHQMIGFGGLSVIFSLVALFSFAIFLERKDSWWLRLQIILVGTLLLHHFSLRPKTLAWFFLAIMFAFFYQRGRKKLTYLLPFIFLLWANLHGSFILGIVFLFFIQADPLVIFLSILATLVNPYGLRLWAEVLRTVFDFKLRWSISEWLPIFFDFHLMLLLLIPLFCALVFRYWSNWRLREKIFFILLLGSGVSSTRNMPIWVLFTLPLTNQATSLLTAQVKKSKISVLRFNQFHLILFLIACMLACYQIITDLNQARGWAESVFYPKSAVVYLRRHLPKGEIFTMYEWGGYLVWQLPQKRVFINGMMSIWPDVLVEYERLLFLKEPFKRVRGKYHITTILLRRRLMSDYDFWRNNQRRQQFVNEVVASGFRQIYQDPIASIYSTE